MKSTEGPRADGAEDLPFSPGTLKALEEIAALAGGCSLLEAANRLIELQRLRIQQLVTQLEEFNL